MGRQRWFPTRRNAEHRLAQSDALRSRSLLQMKSLNNPSRYSCSTAQLRGHFAELEHSLEFLEADLPLFDLPADAAIQER